MKLLVKILFILTIVLLALALAGCKKDPGAGLSYNFKQGFGGLQLTLLDNAPPEKIYPNSEFKVVVKAENLAAYDLTRGSIRIIGLDDKYFEVDPQEHLFFTLKGKSITLPSGDFEFFEFNGRSGELFENAEKNTANYFLKATFDSKVEFTDTVCINPNLYEVYQSGCTVENEKSYPGQGAPFGVVKMEEIISPGGNSQVEFRLTLGNKGQGKVKTITLGEAKLGGKVIDCELIGAAAFQDTIELLHDDQEVKVICKDTVRGFNSYETTLTVDFSYVYELREKQQLVLVK